MRADIVVAKDGSGKFKTVNEAVAAAPENSDRRFIIYVKKGVYSENTEIEKLKTNLTLIGDGSNETILTDNLNFKDGYPITKSATFATNAKGFMAVDICFRNTAGPEKEQAVALHVTGDVSVMYRCRIDGYQDSLFADINRQFYRDCYITGTIDFIFGNAAAVFQNCQIVARKPLSGQFNVLTAQGRTQRNQTSAFSLQKCSITASSDLVPTKKTVKTFLGRPWKDFSRVVIMQSFIDDLVDPQGWAPWDNNTRRLSTLVYKEFENHGPGADTSNRVTWPGYKAVNDPKEATKFTVTNLIEGDLWLNYTGVPYEKGL
ncbi:PREDICTED: pectinesterase/pectinesterase inhibitor 18-like [Camelina sativa]|uniref:Pectinesterase n=1 Tax=Camelina sativa TaxID=90675 RepID=A0ABM0Y7G6_CAMSA|nr:PREDICTED: pectinesterase/pectinesterase inhibitor 18-like [Camelina sativa]